MVVLWRWMLKCRLAEDLKAADSASIFLFTELLLL